MKIVLSILLVISAGLNAVLWIQVGDQRETVSVAETHASDVENSKASTEVQPARQPLAAPPSDAEGRELLRLRNEVSQ